MEPEAQPPRARVKRKYIIRDPQPARVATRAFAQGRYEMIREAAERRARTPGVGGDAVEHWFAAEADVEARLGRMRPF